MMREKNETREQSGLYDVIDDHHMMKMKKRVYVIENVETVQLCDRAEPKELKLGY